MNVLLLRLNESRSFDRFLMRLSARPYAINLSLLLITLVGALMMFVLPFVKVKAQPPVSSATDQLVLFGLFAFVMMFQLQIIFSWLFKSRLSLVASLLLTAGLPALAIGVDYGIRWYVSRQAENRLIQLATTDNVDVELQQTLRQLTRDYLHSQVVVDVLLTTQVDSSISDEWEQALNDWKDRSSSQAISLNEGALRIDTRTFRDHLHDRENAMLDRLNEQSKLFSQGLIEFDLAHKESLDSDRPRKKLNGTIRLADDFQEMRRESFPWLMSKIVIDWTIECLEAGSLTVLYDGTLESKPRTGLTYYDNLDELHEYDQLTKEEIHDAFLIKCRSAFLEFPDAFFKRVGFKPSDLPIVRFP